MIVGIDASNIGIGGGVTHLKEILENFDIEYFNNDITSIVIFSSDKVLSQIPDSPLIDKVTFPNLNRSLAHRIWFQLTRYNKEVKHRCDILYSVAGDYKGDFKPLVAMSRNMLLYERNIWREIKQPLAVLQFWINFHIQRRCFTNASGIIFISEYAQKAASRTIDISSKPKSLIHHGVSPRFLGKIRDQRSIIDYNFNDPFKILYVSSVHIYKHQWNVVSAISQLRKKGYPVELHLVGRNLFKRAGKMLFQTMKKEDPKKEYIFYHGELPYDKIEKQYQSADGIVFASTCENMPNILIESMASGVPIACSKKEPMPEFLKSGGFYFDAKNVNSICDALESLLLDDKLSRQAKLKQNHKEIGNYSWKKTSRLTFEFIVKNYESYAQK